VHAKGGKIVLQQRGVELSIAPRERYYGGGAKGYTDWPNGNY